MKQKLRLLDLFCGAGGAGEGYALSGFDVTGVDIHPQPNNPHRFIQSDALTYLVKYGHQYDVIHASPPCQRYSVTSNMHPNKTYPDLIAPVRELLNKLEKPWIMENVPGAPMENYIVLDGTMFNLRVIRRRYFESNIMLLARSPGKRKGYTSGKGKSYSSFDDGYYVTVAGNNYRYRDGCIAMGINWMTQTELSQAIPPAYTKYIGQQVFNHINLTNDN